MANYTDNLPDISDEWKSLKSDIIGKSTKQCLLSGSYWSMVHEMRGIISVFETGEKNEIKTPKGSYFTREPLGEEGKLAFVFPGLGSSYIGLGQKIFQLFPSIFKESFRFTQNVGEDKGRRASDHDQHHCSGSILFKIQYPHQTRTASHG